VTALQAADASTIPKWLHFCAALLPNWHRFFRRLRATCASTCSCLSATAHCECCSGVDQARLCACCCCSGCVVLLIVSVVLCHSLKSNAGRTVFCILAEIILIFFQVGLGLVWFRVDQHRLCCVVLCCVSDRCDVLVCC
jgi:hypothetical protein